MLPKMMRDQPGGNRVAAGSGVKGALAGLVSLFYLVMTVTLIRRA